MRKRLFLSLRLLPLSSPRRYRSTLDTPSFHAEYRRTASTCRPNLSIFLKGPFSRSKDPLSSSTKVQIAPIPLLLRQTVPIQLDLASKPCSQRTDQFIRQLPGSSQSTSSSPVVPELSLKLTSLHCDKQAEREPLRCISLSRNHRFFQLGRLRKLRVTRRVPDYSWRRITPSTRESKSLTSGSDRD